jgi:MerR family transcriptional regulator, light-induced transcriptional regulator
MGINMYREVNLDKNYLSGKAFDAYSKTYPELWENFSAYQKACVMDDFKTDISYLEESLAINNAIIFIDYVLWAHALHSSRHFPKNYVSSSLIVLNEVLGKELPPDFREITNDIIKKSVGVLKKPREEIPSFITKDNPRHTIAQAYLDALIVKDTGKAQKIIAAAVKSGVTVQELYPQVFEKILQETGRLWQAGDLGIAEEHYITASVEQEITRLHDYVLSEGKRVIQKNKTLVAACIEKERHEIGIRMVADFFEMDGWETCYIGADTPSWSLIAVIRDRNADAVAISTTIAFHLPAINYLIRSLRADPKTKHVKIIVGGHPFAIVPDLWIQVGADACAGNASDAVAIANQLTLNN